MIQDQIEHAGAAYRNLFQLAAFIAQPAEAWGSISFGVIS